MNVYILSMIDHRHYCPWSLEMVKNGFHVQTVFVYFERKEDADNRKVKNIGKPIYGTSDTAHHYG